VACAGTRPDWWLSEATAKIGPRRRRSLLEVRIGIIQTAKELDVELAEGTSREQVLADIETALGSADGVLWLTDKRGRRVGVPTGKVAYVEVGAASDDRRVGFGAP
jgi:hypothetical protein